MFESIEIRRVSNGFVLTLATDDGEIREYVYDTPRKAMRVIKQHIEAAPNTAPTE